MGFKGTLSFMLVLVVLSITGCVNCTIRINEHDDQSADIIYQVSISKVATRLISDQGINPIEDLKQLAVLNGFTVKDYTPGNTIGYTAERQVDAVTQIPNLMRVFAFSGTNKNAPVQINKSLLYHEIRLNTNIDLSGIYGQPGSKEEQLAKTLIKGANLKLMYTTSKTPLNHNCDLIINNGESKTYVWKLKLDEPNKIILTTKTLQTGSIAALAVLGLIICYCILMYIYLAKKESKQQVAAAVNKEDMYKRFFNR